MRDKYFQPVLEHVMVPKSSYENILEFSESHHNHRTFIPNATFVNYNESFALMEQFVQDAIEAVTNGNFTNDDISIATQKFVTESAQLWKSEPIYHNRILNYMESAYIVPEKARDFRNKLIVEHSEMTDAINYMLTKYLEKYMEHVDVEMAYLESYIGDEEILPMIEHMTNGFSGFYMAEAMGGVAAIPGMILALVRKLMKKITFALSEAGKSFANQILQNNQINEDAIKKIYQLYQAKSRSGQQPPIRYPDPKLVNQLRQSYATGFDAFTQQMVQGIQENNFQGVDQGVVQMINNFHVITTNLTLNRNASFQEFRTAVLSIANNILLMDGLMKSLTAIDDAICQKYQVDPSQLDKDLEKQITKNLGNETLANRQQAQAQRMQNAEESIEFDSLFVEANVQSNPNKSNPSAQNNPADTATSTADQQASTSGGKDKKQKYADDDYSMRAQASRAVESFKSTWFEKLIIQSFETVSTRFATRALSEISDQLFDALLNLITGGMSGGMFGESVEYMLEDGTQSTPTASQSQPIEQSVDDNQSPINILDASGVPVDTIANPNFMQKLLETIGIAGDKLQEWINFMVETIGGFIDSMTSSGKQSTEQPDGNITQQTSIESTGDQSPKQSTSTNASKEPVSQNKANIEKTNASIEYDDSVLDMFVEARDPKPKGQGVINSAINFITGAGVMTAASFTAMRGAKKLKGMFNAAAKIDAGDAAGVAKLAMKVGGFFKNTQIVGLVTRYINDGKKKGQKGKDIFMDIMKDPKIKSWIINLTIFCLGTTVIVVVQKAYTGNPKGNLQKTIAQAEKLPAPKRAAQNISATKEVVPPLAVKLWNDADLAIKNLWTYVNGWLYGGQQIKGSKEKTVGLANMIKQEMDSLAPYVNMKNVVDITKTF